MITWLRFAYVSLAIWYFSVACKFGSIHTRSAYYWKRDQHCIQSFTFFYRVSFLLFSFFFFFCLSTLNSTCHLCPRHQISEMLLQRWRSPCNQRFCPKTGEASCPMNGTMKSSSSWIEKISTVVRSHELTSLKVIICAISRWSTHISCHRHISFFFFLSSPFPLRFFCSFSLSRSHVRTQVPFSSLLPSPHAFNHPIGIQGIRVVFPDQTSSFIRVLYGYKWDKNCCVNVADRLKRY